MKTRARRRGAGKSAVTAGGERVDGRLQEHERLAEALAGVERDDLGVLQRACEELIAEGLEQVVRAQCRDDSCRDRHDP